MIIFALFHTLSNTLEWGWKITLLDPLEDFIEILEVVLWAFFLFSFIQTRKEFEILIQQEKMLHLAKFESIGNLAGGITHDLRNFLGVIIGNLELLEMDTDLTEEYEENLKFAKEAAFKAKEISDNLLSLVKEQKLTLSKINLSNLLKDTISLTLSNAKTSVNLDHLLENIEIIADKNQIERVFHNLLINASQAMNNAGSIEIFSQILSIQTNEIFGLEAGRYIRTDLKDYGPGIPREHITAIFDPYFTTKANGVGLGLSVAFNIIRNHKGTIEVHSEENEGTCFSIYLPLSGKKSK